MLLDYVIKYRAASHLWAWAPEHPPAPAISDFDRAFRWASVSNAGEYGGDEDPAGCTFMHAASDGRWRTAPCAEVEGGGGAEPGVTVAASCRNPAGGGGGGGGSTVAAAAAGGSRQAGVAGSVGLSLSALSSEGAAAAVALGEESNEEGEEGGPAPLPPLPSRRAPLWRLVPLPETPSWEPVACPEGWSHEAPRSAQENLLLRLAAVDAGVDRVLLPLKPPTYLPWIATSEERVASLQDEPAKA